MAFEGPAFGGMLKSLVDGLARQREVGQMQQMEQQRQETAFFQQLLHNENPEVRAMAAMGLMEASSPRKGQGFMSRLLGKVQENPVYPKLLAFMQGPGKDLVGISPPPPSPSAAAPQPMGAPPAGPPLGVGTAPAGGAAPAPPGTPQPSAAMFPSTAPGPTPEGLAAVGAAQPQAGAPEAQAPIPPSPMGPPPALEKPAMTPLGAGGPGLRPITQSATDIAYQKVQTENRAKADLAAEYSAMAGEDPQDQARARMVAISVLPRPKAQTPWEVDMEGAKQRVLMARAAGKPPDPYDAYVSNEYELSKRMTPSERDKFMARESFKRLEYTATAAMERAKLAAATSRSNTNARIAARVGAAHGLDPDAVEAWTEAQHAGPTIVPKEFKTAVLMNAQASHRPPWSKKLDDINSAFSGAEGSLDNTALALDRFSRATKTELGQVKSFLPYTEASFAWDEYQASLKAFTSRQFLRSAGERGPQTQKDIDAMLNMLMIGQPATILSPPEAQHRIDSAYNVLARIKNRYIDDYTARTGGAPAGITKTPLRGAAPTKDPGWVELP